MKAASVAAVDKGWAVGDTANGPRILAAVVVAGSWGTVCGAVAREWGESGVHAGGRKGVGRVRGILLVVRL